ncbi:MAG: hypothetical protein H0A75_04395 [Candidatus Methanofishera endochildressiae]|uniref:Uncharacterized protein n=1 Tax=Candidatus Methanofishera endochildressiae TaxID=2738884 RepID=A0A7Z0SF28_9GAMM|nr:hypothetical protein [Candidatus Methanofishera endochildressiae]
MLNDQLIGVLFNEEQIVKCWGKKALLNELEFNVTQINPHAVEHQETLDVKISAPEACPRYLGRLIKGVNATAETPLWMQELCVLF